MQQNKKRHKKKIVSKLSIVFPRLSRVFTRPGNTIDSNNNLFRVIVK